MHSDLLPEVDRRGLGEGGLGVAPYLPAAPAPVIVDTVEEHVATGLADIEQPDGETVEAFRTGHPAARGGNQLRGRVQNRGHGTTSLVTGMLPREPPTQPSMMAENK